MNPNQAVSPRDRIWPGSLKIIYTSNNGWWSLAEMRWRDGDDYNDPESWCDVVSCRWNGDLSDPDDKGNPRSHGQGTWFVLPPPLAAHARAFVASMLSEAHAEADAILAAEARQAANPEQPRT